MENKEYGKTETMESRQESFHDDDTVKHSASDNDDDDDDEYSYSSDNDAVSMPASMAMTQQQQQQQQGNKAYSFCTMSQAQASLDQVANQTAEMLGVSSTVAAVLLRKHAWDAEALLQQYLELDDPTRLLQECGVLHRATAATATTTSASSTGKNLPSNNRHKAVAATTTTCLICFDTDVVSAQLYGMACRHLFCKDCWYQYLTVAVETDGLAACRHLTCPATRCTEVVTRDDVMHLGVAGPILQKYTNYMMRANIETCRHGMRWCPGAACDMVAVWQAGTARDAAFATGFVSGTCPTCHTTFCFTCGESHVLVPCRLLAQWQTKCPDESETANWMLVHSKKCPQCENRIEKDGGCNHMHCTQCNYHFCWQCMKNWNVHDFAAKSLREFIATQDDNEKLDSTFDWEALKASLVQLVECRRMLKYTYVAAYYMQSSHAKQLALFQDHQGILESFTERLSEITEKSYTDIDRAEMVNVTASVATYIKSLQEYDIEDIDR